MGSWSDAALDAGAGVLAAASVAELSSVEGRRALAAAVLDAAASAGAPLRFDGARALADHAGWDDPDRRSRRLATRVEWESSLPPVAAAQARFARVVATVLDAVEASGIDSSSWLWGSGVDDVDARTCVAVRDLDPFACSLDLDRVGAELRGEVAGGGTEAVERWSASPRDWAVRHVRVCSKLIDGLVRPPSMTAQEHADWLHLDVELAAGIESDLRVGLTASELDELLAF